MIFNSDIVNFVWKTDEGEAESIVLLIFVLWQGLNLRCMRGGGVGAESLIYLKSYFFPAGLFHM